MFICFFAFVSRCLHSLFVFILSVCLSYVVVGQGRIRKFVCFYHLSTLYGLYAYDIKVTRLDHLFVIFMPLA